MTEFHPCCGLLVIWTFAFALWLIRRTWRWLREGYEETEYEMTIASHHERFMK